MFARRLDKNFFKFGYLKQHLRYAYSTIETKFRRGQSTHRSPRAGFAAHVQCCSNQWGRQGDTEGDRISGQREIPRGEGGWKHASPRIFFISRVSKTLFAAFLGKFIDNVKATHP